MIDDGPKSAVIDTAEIWAGCRLILDALCVGCETRNRPQKRGTVVRLRLHHVNVTSDDIGTLSKFYSDALGLAKVPIPPMIAHIAVEGYGCDGR